MPGIEKSFALFTGISMRIQFPVIERLVFLVRIVLGQVEIPVGDQASRDQKIMGLVAGEGQGGEKEPCRIESVNQETEKTEAPCEPPRGQSVEMFLNGLPFTLADGEGHERGHTQARNDQESGVNVS